MVSHLHELGLDIRVANRDLISAPEDLLKKQQYIEDAEDASPAQENKQSCSIKMASLADDLIWLQEPNFLSDQIITFSFNNMASRMNNDVLLMEATVPYLFSHALESDVAAYVDSLDLPSRHLVLLPVNDNENPAQANGGFHWSLLVIDHRVQDHTVFIHYDSLGYTNLPASRQLYKRLHPQFPGQPVFVQADTPRQQNGFDCALYVIAIAREICKWWMSHAEGGGDNWSAAIASQLNAQTVDVLRRQLIEIIERQLSKL